MLLFRTVNCKSSWITCSSLTSMRKENRESGNWSPFLSVLFLFLRVVFSSFSVCKWTKEKKRVRGAENDAGTKKGRKINDTRNGRRETEWDTLVMQETKSFIHSKKSYWQTRLEDRRTQKVEAKTIKGKEQDTKQKGTRHHHEWRGGKERSMYQDQQEFQPRQTPWKGSLLSFSFNLCRLKVMVRQEEEV